MGLVAVELELELELEFVVTVVVSLRVCFVVFDLWVCFGLVAGPERNDPIQAADSSEMAVPESDDSCQRGSVP